MNERVLIQQNDSELIYFPDFSSESLFETLKNELDWKQNSVKLFGKTYAEPRLTAWYGPAYSYSGIQLQQAEMPLILRPIFNALNEAFDFPFNSVLANYYRSGNESMGWHRDNEREMDQTMIASVSFGGTRHFRIKHIANKQTMNVELSDRSLLVMKNMQSQWLHAIPKSKKLNEPRINLTFRRIVVPIK